ncbi:Threonine synthase, partial [Pseudolycoriella hygida]
MPVVSFFECSRCHQHVQPDKYHTVCPACAGVLYVRYDMDEVKRTASRPNGVDAPQSMWRYADVLPKVDPVTLGEGWTPLLQSRRYPIFIKEEAMNPTGSFKARGMSMAVSMARFYGVKKLTAPSAGNAAGALAAYCAAAGIEANIFMPKDVPFANYLEGVVYGSNVTLVDGIISDCARIVNERKDKEGWFDITTLKEPFRVEGKKTMGYEVVEQLGWSYPDAIFYPTGGGVGLIGMWKAFDEMEKLGWVSGKRPKMIAVQASGCAPMSRAWKEGADVSQFYDNATTFASGLRVPKPYGDYIILDILRKSEGTCVDLSEEEILASLLDWSRNEGILLCPEGAVATAAYDKLIADGF